MSREQKGPGLVDIEQGFKMPYWYRRILGLLLDLVALVLQQGSTKWNKRVWMYFIHWKYRLLVWQIFTWKYLTEPLAWWIVFPEPGAAREPLEGKLIHGPGWDWKDKWKEKKV